MIAWFSLLKYFPFFFFFGLLSFKENRNSCCCCFSLSIIIFFSLAARVGRKRGKMNLEKAINTNRFNISSAIRNANPLMTTNETKINQDEHCDETLSTLTSSIISNPKQKFSTQFKRAITIIKQRNDQSNDTLPVSLSSLVTNTEKSADLTSLVEQSMQANDNNDSISQIPSLLTITPSFVHNKCQPICEPSSSFLSHNNMNSNNSPSNTIISIDSPIKRTNNSSARIIKQSLQQIHSSILQTMHQHHPLSTSVTSSSSATISPSPTSSSTMGTGEVAILETIL